VAEVMTKPDISDRQVLLKKAFHAMIFHLSPLSFQLSAGGRWTLRKIRYLTKASLLAFAFLISLLLPCLANADISVTLSPDRKQATIVDSIRLVVSVSGTRSCDSEPIIKGLEAFDLTQGGTSSQVQIINGKISSGIDYTYFIQPKKTGTFQIGPAEVRAEGGAFRSNTAKLTISKLPQSSGIDRGPIFLTTELSSKKTYEQEQAIYTLKLYRQTKVSDISLDLRENKHLSFKQLGKPVTYQSLYEGKTYQVLEVRYALLPSREGDYEIGPARMHLTVFQPRQRSRRSLFDDPFFSFSTGKPMTLASEPLELKVLPLPEEGKPADFSGLVGNFGIDAKLEPSEARVGESVTLTACLSGRGNVNRIPDLIGPEVEHTKVYDDQPVLEVYSDDKGMTGSKTMKWALVPEREGLYEISPLTVSFFDTKSREYRVIRTSPLSLSVLPREEQIQPSADRTKKERPEGPGKEAVKELGHDILPVHTSVKDLKTGFPGFPTRRGALFFWLVLIGPAIFYALAFCGMKFSRKSVKALAVTKTKKAAKTLIKQCRHERLRSSDLAEAIRDYLNDRFGLALGSLTPDEAVEILKSKGVNLDTTQKLQSILQRLEDAIYTGKGDDSSDIGQDLPDLINQIEKEIG
jgi:hypothetical protein